MPMVCQVSAASIKLSKAHNQKGTTTNTSIGASVVKSFSDVLDFVVLHNARVLRDPEIKFSAEFHGLSPSAQFLFLRLFLRKGPWFRVDKLHYAEVQDPARVIQELCDAGLCMDQHALHMEAAVDCQLSVMNVSELKELSSKLNIKINVKRKAGIVDELKQAIYKRAKKVSFQLYRSCSTESLKGEKGY